MLPHEIMEHLVDGSVSVLRKESDEILSLEQVEVVIVSHPTGRVRFFGLVYSANILQPEEIRQVYAQYRAFQL